MTGSKHIYTDGAAPDNQHGCIQGGIGLAFYDHEHNLVDTYKETIRPPEGEFTTNNRCELLAFLHALANAGSKDIIYTDSEYVERGYNVYFDDWKKRGWRRSNKKRVLNLDLWMKIDLLREHRMSVKLVKVKGHDNVEGNELADRLATEAALGQ